MNDPYETLGVGRNANKKDIDKAFRRRSRATHPDAGGDKDESVAVTAAYTLLSNPESKKHYDRTGEEPQGNGRAEVETIVGRMVPGAFLQDKVDPVEFIRQELRKCLAGFKQEKSKAELHASKWERKLTKFVNANENSKNMRGRELIEGALRSRIHGARNAVIQLEKQIEMASAGLELMSNLSCPVEQQSSTTCSSAFTINFGGTTMA